MNSKSKIIIGTYIATFFASIIYVLYMIQTIPESGSMGIPFGFIAVLGISLFIESLLFGLIFIRDLKNIGYLIFPVFLLTSILPGYFVITWYDNLPVTIPEPGVIPVSPKTYKELSEAILADFEAKDLDSNKRTKARDTILATEIDTILFSENLEQFFSIIIGQTRKEFCSFYRVGNLHQNTYMLSKPKGNIWSTHYDSKDALKRDLRQYYYKKYAINNDSGKPSIWEDKYIFTR